MICPICSQKHEPITSECKTCHFSFYAEKASIFSTLLGNRKHLEPLIHDETVQKIINYLKIVYELSKKDSYVAYSMYKDARLQFETTYQTVISLQQTQMISGFCKTNQLEERNITRFIELYRKIDEHVTSWNDRFINDFIKREKYYFDNILKEVDAKISLDEQQRFAVVCDEDNSLIIAGAGAGKTTTVAAKVKYLVEKQGVQPEEILVISYTNKAVNELKDRINKQLKIDCPITTFHSTGHAIMRKFTDEKYNIIRDNFYFVQKIISDMVATNQEMLKKLVLFFSLYLDFPEEALNFSKLEDFYNYRVKKEFTTLKGDIGEFNEVVIDSRSKQQRTIQNEFLRSMQEVQIANYLYMNGIDYEYERRYPFQMQGSKKLYTPDFYLRQGDLDCYLEHFGISEDGHHTLYSPAELEQYKHAIHSKIALHQKHRTPLIYTYSTYNNGQHFIDVLRRKLIDFGFELHPRDPKEIYDQLIKTENDKYLLKFVQMISTFLHNYKTNGYSRSEIRHFRSITTNPRDHLFLDIFEAVYDAYQKFLHDTKQVDFEDMINESYQILQKLKHQSHHLPFKYVIVDEYQDISHQRFNLAKELTTLTHSKMIAVGDDWQSIFAFAGSDITLFTQFAKEVGYARELHISNTYRNSQELIDIAGHFIQKNQSQIQKHLHSPKHQASPLRVYSYDDRYYAEKGRPGILLAKATVLQNAIDDLISLHGKNQSILVVGRYNFDAKNLAKTGLFTVDDYGNFYSTKHPQLKIIFLTTHSAKGLGFDNVILINAENSIYGFPSQIEDDPIMRFVVHEDKSFFFAEERRLFYVALTRTKNNIFIIAPQNNPSEFVVELIVDYPSIPVVGGALELEPKNVKIKNKKCPHCGFPMVYRNSKNYGLRLWICTNDPEICSFMTNEYASKVNIVRCPECTDGFLIAKRQTSSNGYIIGCTNYKTDKTGCNHIVPYRSKVIDENERI